VAVSVDEAPAQIIAGEADADTFGRLFTTTTTDAVEVQPPDSPVTVIVVVEGGDTAVVEPVPPELHV
jgi:hypothetical protein